MQVRDKLDGKIHAARLEFRGTRGKRRGFILVILDRAGRFVLVDRLTAAIRYELGKHTPADRVTLALAGFELARANQHSSPLVRLTRVLLSTMKKRPKSVVHRRKELSSAKSQHSAAHVRNDSKRDAPPVTANRGTTTHPKATNDHRSNLKHKVIKK